MKKHCPTCSTVITERGKYFPFCSERCRLIDLDGWFAGRYAVPAVESDEEEGPAPDPKERPDDQ